MAPSRQHPLPELTDNQQALFALCSPDAQKALDLSRTMLLASLRDSGWSLTKIARLFGTSKQLVAHWLAAR